MLSPSEIRTLRNAQRLVASLGDTPLAQNLAALTARLERPESIADHGMAIIEYRGNGPAEPVFTFAQRGGHS